MKSSRIEFLRNEAREDGITLNAESEADFQRFARSVSGMRRCNLVLLDNGDLRAIWKDGRGSHIGLHFLGGGIAQYVVFKRRPDEQRTSRSAGRVSLDDVRQRIEALDVGALLYARNGK